MAPSRNTIENTLNEYNTALSSKTGSENIELEAKIHSLSADTFAESLKTISKMATLTEISTTINVIVTENDSNGAQYSCIQTHVYDNNKKVSETNTTKKVMGMKFNASSDIMKYSLACSRESPSPVRCNTFSALNRFKIRLSFVDPNNDSWRYDYTLTYQLENYGNILGLIAENRNELFAGIKSTMNIAEILPIVLAKNMMPKLRQEIEVERVSQKPIDGRTEVDRALGFLWKTFGMGSESDDPRNKLIHEVYELISNNNVQRKLTLKNALNAAKSMTKSSYYNEMYPPIGWFVTDKADGERCLVYAAGNKVNVIYSGFETATIADGTLKSIIDCELIITTSGKRRLGIFDVMYCNDQNLTTMTIEDRLGFAKIVLAQILEPLRSIGIEAFVKEYVQISQPMEEAILKVYNNRRDYKTDGLILASQTDNYYETKNRKWKPTEENTIDFMVIECPKTFLGKQELREKPGKKLYVLMCGMNTIRRKQLGITLWPDYKADTGVENFGGYIPVLFQSVLWPYAYVYYHDTTSDGPMDLHGKICEFSINKNAADTLKSAFSKGAVNSDLDIWKLNRVREDRSVAAGEYGNDFDIAEQIFSNIIDPFNLDDLWLGNSSYFEKQRDTIYRAPNKFKRFVIKQAFEKYLQPGMSVLDLAAGRGADLGPYNAAEIGRLVAIDIDPTALVELIHRSTDKHIVGMRKNGTSMKLNVLVSDVSGNPNVNKNAINERFAIENVDIIVCNFAFHYFCTSASALNNALSFISAMCNNNHDTYFIMTVLDGQKVFDLLKDTDSGASWKVVENSMEKYLIRKDYESNTFERFGQKISVKLPMTTKLYTEPLCNISAVSADAEKFGLELVSNEQFKDFLSKFSASEPHVASSLTNDDIMYCDLHSLVVFKKTAKKKTGAKMWSKKTERVTKE